MTQKTKFKGVISIIMVEDLDAAMAYYTEKLGFNVQFVSEWDYNGVERDGLQVHIGKGKPNPVTAHGVHFYIHVENIDDLREEFLASGAITEDVKVVDQPYGQRELYVRDPFGYQLGFYQ
ncbi:putative glyoxalase superfamily protein PhnB [Tumebacillus sp. BK434]|uniref:glyoxalase superfamily protein n=1 Tax=Tumebacillus sp. BK434 TaxID=2512169 RepID=UPI0010442B57|nr:glyoxalase superfamily protein [Tumebacillus sp. BK434]TCP57945.1 putative glyoxalase superfamily protein PhnB [Tumebacillus sp. BK434]